MKYFIKGYRNGTRRDIYVAYDKNTDDLFKCNLQEGDVIEYETEYIHSLLVVKRAEDTYHVCHECAFGEWSRFMCPRRQSGACLVSRTCCVFHKVSEFMEEL